MYLWLISTILLIIYKWSTSNFDYFEKIGIPYEKPKPLVGNMWSLLLQKESIAQMFQRSYNKYKKSKIFGLFNFKQVSFVVMDPEIVKNVTIKDFDSFVNHNEKLNGYCDEILSKGLFSLFNQRWRDMRHTLSPVFTGSKMKMMFGLLTDHVQDFMKYIDEEAEIKGEIIFDVKDIFSRFTADGISTSALGFEGDCVRNDKSYVYKIVQKIMSEFLGPLGMLKMMFAFSMPKLYKFTGLQLFSQEVIDFFKRVVTDVITERELKGISRPDVIQLLLQTKKGQSLEKEKESDDKELSNFAANVEYNFENKTKKVTNWDDKDLMAQGFIFFGAGFETTSTLLQMVTYELAKNPEIQQELIDEIDGVLSNLDGKPVTYEALHKMKYLDMVVSESLRMWPPILETDRQCTTDYVMDLGDGKKVNIYKGDLIFLPIFNIHRDPENYKNPDKFDPTRFSDENKSNIHPGAFIPFGIGPRVCIGSRFALMESKLLVFNILSKFNIKMCNKTPKDLTCKPTTINLAFNEEIHLQLKLRTKFQIGN